MKNDKIVSNTPTKTFLGQLVDLQDYNKIFPETHPSFDVVRGTFIGWDWFLIKNIDPDLSTELDQSEVREVSNSLNREYELMNDMIYFGWKMESFPPVIDTNGNIIDGRTRILGAIRAGAEYIPVAIFSYEPDTTLALELATAQRLNNHVYSQRSVQNDFIVSGVASIEDGSLKRNEDAILKWLVDECDIAARFSNISGIWTKIVKQVMIRTSKEKELVLVRSRASWLKYLSKVNLGDGIHIDDCIVYQANTGTSASRFWSDHVLTGNIKNKCVILYTDEYSPYACGKALEIFVQKLKQYNEATFDYVTYALMDAITIKSMEMPVKFLGVIPNLKKNNQPELFKSKKFVAIKQYMLDALDVDSVISTNES